MGFLLLLGISFTILIIYFIYSSYFIQIIIFKSKKKEIIKQIRNSVKGIYLKEGYFSINNKVIDQNKFNHLTNKEKLKFGTCYDIVYFKTENTNWELFFNLIRDGTKYVEVLNIRSFSTHNHIKSEGNIEKNLSRLNIFTNSHYLSQILENTEIYDTIEWLIKNNTDLMLINYNRLHFKTQHETKLKESKILEKIKAINQIKNKIYKKGILEY